MNEDPRETRGRRKIEEQQKASVREVYAVARQVQKKYEALRRRVHPEYSSGTKFDDEWVRAAETILSLGAEPYFFVEAQFQKTPGRYPFPNQLYGEWAINNYKEVFAIRPQQDAELEFDNEVRALNDYISTYKTDLDSILQLGFLPIKSYIRVVFCTDNALPVIQERWGRAAKLRLEKDPSLDKLLREKYVSRYARLFPQRVPERPRSEHAEDIGPPSKASGPRIRVRRP